MASSVMASVSLKPSSLTFEKSAAGRRLPSLARLSSFRVEASGGKKIKTDKPYWKGCVPIIQYVDKYGANVDAYSSIYNTDDWSPSGDVYVGAGGALLVYNTSALTQ